ncbi:sensor histidine kinase [Microbacterium lacticum]|uniref:sensor histidine kinase n=1 Tax=Microbacterium lacticum TaxID=33885 RepID=UPI001F57350E|nr:histidine kinase [Microbacterium lacticum]
MSPTQEPLPLRRMRASVTGTFVVVLGVYAGVTLVIASASWWQPLLLAPSMIAAVWTAARWHTPIRPLATVSTLALGEATWLIASWLAISPAAAFGLSVAGAVTISKLPGRRGTFGALLVTTVLATGLLSLVEHSDQAAGYLLIAPLITAVLVGVFWLNQLAWQMFAELDATRRAETKLALVKERFRFATDLHDIQGHTLHVVKLKTALVARLIRADPDTANDELRQVQDLIAQTITQTRSLAYGQRKITLVGELENAKNLFEAAGIQVNVTRDGNGPASALDEYASLVLREATTNILRHTQATRVGITLGTAGISITNDGAAPGPTPRLRGLADLQQRVADAGGTLTVNRASGTFLTAAVFDSDDAGTNR